MTITQRTILTDGQVKQILRRIAFEIYENNFDEQEICIIGVYDKGYHLAKIISEQLSAIATGVKVSLVRLDIDKMHPAASTVELDVPVDQVKDKVIVLVDDVLNTGKTFAYSLKALLDVEIKKLQVAVLVNRSHNQFPISANYSGYELSTTLNEHVEVRLEGEPGVFLY